MAPKLIVLAPFQFAGDDPLCVYRGVVARLSSSLGTISTRKWRPSRSRRGDVALKFIVLAPFLFASDETLGVGGVSWRQN